MGTYNDGTEYQAMSSREEADKRHQKQKIPLQNDVAEVVQEFNDRKNRAMSNFIVSTS
jgi:hypothetical protein